MVLGHFYVVPRPSAKPQTRLSGSPSATLKPTFKALIIDPKKQNRFWYFKVGFGVEGSAGSPDDTVARRSVTDQSVLVGGLSCKNLPLPIGS